jgi:hypothetical protein
LEETQRLDLKKVQLCSHDRESQELILYKAVGSYMG